MTLQLLDNIVWHSLTGAHAPYSAGSNTARRYAKGFTPIVGFADNARARPRRIARALRTG